MIFFPKWNLVTTDGGKTATKPEASYPFSSSFPFCRLYSQPGSRNGFEEWVHLTLKWWTMFFCISIINDWSWENHDSDYHNGPNWWDKGYTWRFRCDLTHVRTFFLSLENLKFVSHMPYPKNGVLSCWIVELSWSKVPSRSSTFEQTPFAHVIPSLQRLQGLFGIIFLLCQAFISGPMWKLRSTFILLWISWSGRGMSSGDQISIRKKMLS